MRRHGKTETLILENPDGTPESVFEGLHVGDKFLKIYVENGLSLKPDQKRSIERHIIDMCPSGECQGKIDKLVKEIQDDDPKMAQLPENDR